MISNNWSSSIPNNTTFASQPLIEDVREYMCVRVVRLYVCGTASVFCMEHGRRSASLIARPTTNTAALAAAFASGSDSPIVSIVCVRLFGGMEMSYVTRCTSYSIHVVGLSLNWAPLERDGKYPMFTFWMMLCVHNILNAVMMGILRIRTCCRALPLHELRHGRGLWHRIRVSSAVLNIIFFEMQSVEIVESNKVIVHSNGMVH